MMPVVSPLVKEVPVEGRDNTGRELRPAPESELLAYAALSLADSWSRIEGGRVESGVSKGSTSGEEGRDIVGEWDGQEGRRTIVLRPEGQDINDVKDRSASNLSVWQGVESVRRPGTIQNLL